MKKVALRRTVSALALAAGLFGGYQHLAGQSGAARPEPFKLGSFERSGQTFLGIVLRDTQVADLRQANAAFERRNSSARKLTIPTDMKDLIVRYESELKERLRAVAADVAAAPTASYVYQVSALKTLPPVRPAVILNAGGNYTEHTEGIAAVARGRTGNAPAPAPTAVSVPGIWERKAGDTRPENPYLFLKSPTTVTGPFDPIVMPPNRTQIDFECEFNVVIGKTASYVPVARAADYIFGYTIQIDVSDRGGRGDRKMGGSDWLVGKNHDTFAPLGPFIVPKEFVQNPTNLKQTFTLNGQVMQDSNTDRMAHNIYELLSYGSSNLTLSPGDLISGGSPAGTNIERTEPRWMRAGDTAACAIEGIGTQTHPVVAPKVQSTN
jgi:2-keto-4-pentenoate hydratase/2-oxohepta-3-ene-1,7-dioic acid hydratase in catechol pathway